MMVTAPFEHADDARAALREIVAEHGAATLSNPSAMSNLLKDLLPDAPGVARLLVAAAEDRVVERLREQLAQGLDAATAARLTASAFADTTMVAPQVCAWIVEEIASATYLLPGPAIGADSGADPGAVSPPSPLSDLPDAPTIAGRFPPGQATPTPAQAGAAAAVPETADTTPAASAPPTVTTADAGTPLATSASTPAAGGSRKRKRGLLAGALAAVVVLGAVIGLVIAAPWASSPAQRQPVSAAVLEGTWSTHYKVVTSSGSDTTYLAGKQWTNIWTFYPDCGSGPCNVRLSGEISGPGNTSATSFNVRLTRNGAIYTGSVKLTGFESCTVGKKSYPDVSTMSFRIKVIRARTMNNAWAATFWTGTMASFIPRSASGCSADKWTTVISGTF